jgi:pantoate kinase
MSSLPAKHAAAYSPAHITAFFAIHNGRTTTETGSTGAGICLDGGVSTIVKVEPSRLMELKITANSLPFHSPTCESIFRHLMASEEPAMVTAIQESIFPPNYGYGISAASALSLGLALNRAMGMGLTKEEVGVQAHIAEVENKTGLGDVVAELAGGFEFRDKPGAPGLGRAVRLSTGEGMVVISSPVRPFPTRRMITEKGYVERINRYGRESLAAFSSKMNLENLMHISRYFWESVGYVDNVILDVMRQFERAGIQSPSAKKGLAFGLVPEDEIQKVIAAIIEPPPKQIGKDLPTKLQDPRSGRTLIISRISSEGAS